MLDGKVAIVTGGARSIGAAFAKGLASEGAKVVIADLDAAEETIGIIKQAGGEAMAPASPHPLTPSGLCAGSVETSSIPTTALVPASSRSLNRAMS